MKTSLFLGTAISALLVTGIAAAAPANYHADLNPEDVVGGSTAGSTTATADFTIDSATNTLCGNVITFTPAPTTTPTNTEPTSVDIYEGADGANGTNILNLPDTVTGAVLSINYTNVPAATIAEIVNAATPTYVQFATAGFPNPGGEARGVISAGGDGALVNNACPGTPVDYQASGDVDAHGRRQHDQLELELIVERHDRDRARWGHDQRGRHLRLGRLQHHRYVEHGHGRLPRGPRPRRRRLLPQAQEGLSQSARVSDPGRPWSKATCGFSHFRLGVRRVRDGDDPREPGQRARSARKRIRSGLRWTVAADARHRFYSTASSNAATTS